MRRTVPIYIFLCLLFLVVNSAAHAAPIRLFFLHHSTGRYLLNHSDFRQIIADSSSAQNIDYKFWDHDYNYIGVKNAAGQLLGYNYGYEADNTDPDGLHRLWTTDNAARDSILANHDVIAFKSCYPACKIVGDAMLEQYKVWYTDIRNAVAQFTESTFIFMSPPPLIYLSTNLEEADRARAFADWLGRPEFLAGYSNIRYFDFYDLLAHPDDGSSGRNMLAPIYERNHTQADSHPNQLANETIGPILANFMMAAATTSSATGVNALPHPTVSVRNYPNPFNPSTTIQFVLPEQDAVQLQVIDIRGQIVRSLVSGQQPAGNHHVVWDGCNDAGQSVVSGLYLYCLKTSQTTTTGKMLLAK